MRCPAGLLVHWYAFTRRGFLFAFARVQVPEAQRAVRVEF
jgi:hypothetical protein